MIRVLGVIPARGGSKGLPGKNIKPLAGLPLIGHSIRCAKQSPALSRTVVSTDSDEIARVARDLGGDVPFSRPAELARDDTPMMPVLQHALAEVECIDGAIYDAVALLDPTSPGRLPEDISRAVEMLKNNSDAVGVVACSQPTFNPFWVGVIEKNGQLARAFDTTTTYSRRQDVPRFLRINGSLYVWRAEFLRTVGADWLTKGPHLMLEIPEARAFSIDDAYEMAMLEAMVQAKLVSFPWLRDS